TYAAARPVPGVVFGVSVHDLHGYDLGGVVTDPDSIKVTAPVDQGVLRLTLSPLLFNKGAYTLDAYALDTATRRYYDLRRRALRLPRRRRACSSPSGHHRPRHRRSAHGQRRRRDSNRVQRRDLQFPRAPPRARVAGGPLHHNVGHRGHPARLRG